MRYGLRGKKKAPLTQKPFKTSLLPLFSFRARREFWTGLECHEGISGYTLEGVSTGIAACQPTLSKVKVPRLGRAGYSSTRIPGLVREHQDLF